jgi:3D (Asp-Asp-Asp) domain-containing protein
MIVLTLLVYTSVPSPWTVDVTGYCPCEICCGRSADGITASGVRAVGKLLAAPGSIPFHTHIYVPGYSDRPVPVLDRGKAIKGNRLDVLFPTHEQALKWGRRRMTVWVVHQRYTSVLKGSSGIAGTVGRGVDAWHITQTARGRRNPAVAFSGMGPEKAIRAQDALPSIPSSARRARKETRPG